MNSNSSYNNNCNNNISTPSNHLLNGKTTKEGKIQISSPFFTSINLNYAVNSIKCSRKKANKDSKSEKPKNLKNNYLLSLKYLAHKNLSQKYNCTLDKYNLLTINYLLSNKTCRMVTLFKEEMILDYIDEFLKRRYSFKESKERIPKFYLYYKHYSIFFGQPFFTNFSFNVLLQKNGEKKARIYYKNHYQNGESKDEDNENIGFAESGSEDEEEDKKLNNNIKKNNNNTIFNSGVKDNIDNVTLMTTINSLENNTINLELNNEKIEIFSENKMERSNDTTIGDLMEDIYKGIEEANKAKNKNIIKKKKKKNFSLGDNFYNFIKKNINNNNEINQNIKNNKKKLIESINNNNKKQLKNNSIKKKLFYVGHNNINNNCGTALSSNTQRNTNNQSDKIKNLNKKNISSNDINSNINSNKSYKKRKLLSYTNEEVNKLIDPNNKHKSPRIENNNNINLNTNHLNTINANHIYENKKLGNIRKINSPLNINKKQNQLNSNIVLTSINNNHINKIKICKTFKALEDKNKKKKTISKNINKDLYTISGDAKKKINKISFKKLDLGNISETQIFKEKHINKKVKGRNIISPLNQKYIGNYTLTNEYNTLNNLPFSANKNKISLNNNKINNNNKVLYNSIAFQTINNDPGMGHQRTKSNLVQNNIKRKINNPSLSKVLNTEINNAYIKPAIRIKKNDKLYMSRGILNDTNNETKYENKTINNNINKKSSLNNGKTLTNINNSNLANELKNKNLINNIIHNNNSKNTNFNKYILEIIKKSKHQHYNSLTNKINIGNTLNLKGNILPKNKKKITNINLNNIKGYKDKDILQIALSLFVNESSSRNRHNQTNILESLNSNNNFNTCYKLDNNQIAQKYQNNSKRNYNLNININNEININENNAINNSTYVNHTHRINSKNIGGGKSILNNYFGNMNKKNEKKHYIVNLKQKKYNIDNTFNNNKYNYKSTKTNNINDNLIFNLNNNNNKGKKIKTRNYTNQNLNEALTSINNNNLINTVILNNNSVDNNRYLVKNSNKINNKNINNNIIKSYHTKSVTSLSDLMFHNKKLISLYKNLSKSK